MRQSMTHAQLCEKRVISCLSSVLPQDATVPEKVLTAEEKKTFANEKVACRLNCIVQRVMNPLFLQSSSR